MTPKFDKTWAELARETIAAVLKNYTDGGGDLVYLTEADRKSLKKQIDAAYPFHERSHFPYKAWLQERRRVFIALGIPLTHARRQPKETSQLRMFD